MITIQLTMFCDGDGCKETLTHLTEETKTNARRTALDKHGWVHSRAKDYCPECVKATNSKEFGGQLGRRHLIGRHHSGFLQKIG